MTMQEQLRISEEIQQANQQHMEAFRTMTKTYFTFGSDPLYPYGQRDYVEVQAENIDQACELFQATHPNRPGSKYINCAFIYHEEEFRTIRDRFYGGRPPVEVIREG